MLFIKKIRMEWQKRGLISLGKEAIKVYFCHYSIGTEKPLKVVQKGAHNELADFCFFL